MFAARALARRAAQTPALSAASARPLATTPQRTFVSKISRYEGMSDYMSLQQMQLIRDRLAADACGVGTVVSSDTFFYMCKRAAADLGVTDDALKKLISKIDENGDDQIQFAECRAVRKSTGGPRRADNVRGTTRVDGVACLISVHFRTGSRTSLQAERRSSPAL